MKNEPLFIPNGDGYDVTAPGVMLILADMVYGKQDDPTWTGGPKTKAKLRSMLKAASDGGYRYSEELHARLIYGNRSKSTQDMAREACAAAGDETIFEIMRGGSDE